MLDAVRRFPECVDGLLLFHVRSVEEAVHLGGREPEEHGEGFFVCEYGESTFQAQQLRSDGSFGYVVPLLDRELDLSVLGEG